jgi:hypothetical protein
VVKLDVWEQNEETFAALGIEVIARRPIKSYKVCCYILSGKQVLEKIDWPGSYIPIVPVYGDEFTVEGKRWFSSLTRPAFDAQRNYNYWRSTSTELVALAPKVPFIGPEDAFRGEDEAKWATANSESWAFIGYKGQTPPQRQPMPAIPAGAMQEALNASDDMKAITGMHDASLGARSNETSGVAINARKKEGDVSTYHFIDNLSRAIKHAGRILVDLIPHIYNSARIIRVLGPEGEPKTTPIAPQDQQQAMLMKMQEQMMQQQEEREDAEEALRIYDLSQGKYDVAVETGPSFTTQREEARMALTELLRAAPQYADIIGPFLLKSFDFPGADELLEEVKERIDAAKEQQGADGGPDPAVMAELQLKQQELAVKQAEAVEKAAYDRQNLQLQEFKAETDRMKVMIDARKPTDAPRQYEQPY